MEEGSKDNTEVFPLNDYDYLHQIQDEICLEGLDGITLQSLWLRLSNRPRYTLGNKIYNIVRNSGLARFKIISIF